MHIRIIWFGFPVVIILYILGLANPTVAWKDGDDAAVNSEVFTIDNSVVGATYQVQ